MKHLKTNSPLQRDKGLCKKIFFGIAIAVCTSAIQAQNTSYYPDNQGIGGGWSSAFGDFSLANNLGFDNAANGIFSLNGNTTANYNTGNGFKTLLLNKRGNSNTACGSHALENDTASFNTAHGSFALFSNTRGPYNTASGASALYSNLIGIENTGSGYQALYSNADGSYNTADGGEALYKNISGNDNTALGYLSLYNNVAGSDNTAVGATALYVSTGQENSALGVGALANVTGNDNTACGMNAGASLFGTANYNTALGVRTFMGIGSGDYNTAVGYQATLANIGLTNATAIGNGAIALASNQVMIGDVNVTSVLCNPMTWSDQRFKSSIREDDVKGLDFIKLLRPVVYNFDTKKLAEHITANLSGNARKSYLDKDFSESTAIRQSGFLAQEVEEAAKKSGYNFNGVHTPDPKNNADIYTLSYQLFVVPLVKGMQEQQVMIEEQAKINEEQTKTNEDLKKQVADLQKLVDALTKNNNSTGVNELSNTSNGFAMDQNIPNPFSHETTIKYTLTEQTQSAVLNVYDLTGKQITSFPLTQKGASSITITSEKLAAGIYIYSIVADGKIMDSKRMVVAEK